ncbi:hypothetical protein J4732_18775 [Serratia marcescens]|uniref:Uncharacterized protein n=1 Tax=Serratia marcescens TaxID=615 RepID=A0A939NRV7_SERMA|nr:hypothetical protein [Serratia marcescens]
MTFYETRGKPAGDYPNALPKRLPLGTRLDAGDDPIPKACRHRQRAIHHRLQQLPRAYRKRYADARQAGLRGHRCAHSGGRRRCCASRGLLNDASVITANGNLTQDGGGVDNRGVTG